MRISSAAMGALLAVVMGAGAQQELATQQFPGRQAQGAQPGPSQRSIPVDPVTMNGIISRTRGKYPKFYAAYEDSKAHDKLIKQVVWARALGPGKGPAAASGNGVITLDPDYLEPGRPAFDDDRMVVVIYHEIGHLHYYEEVPRPLWNSGDSEQAAFEYSLKMTRKLADEGDCGPLATGVYFMKLRSEGTNLADPHTRALKRMVTEPLYAGYVKYMGEASACRVVNVNRVGRPGTPATEE